MQNRIDNRKWSKNDRIGGLINLPSFHLVDLKEVTPIINKNWLIGSLFGLGIFCISKVIELYNNEQYSEICKYVIIASFFIIAGVVSQYIFIIKKYRELKNKAVSVTYGELGKFVNSISTGGDAKHYRDSTNTLNW